jgi:hypothetical protein
MVLPGYDHGISPFAVHYSVTTDECRCGFAAQINSGLRTNAPDSTRENPLPKNVFRL